MKTGKFDALRWLVIIVISIITVAHVAVYIMGYWAYSQASKGKPIPFVHFQRDLADGGSTLYIGFGFQVRKLHRMGEKKEGKREFTVGYSLDFTSPFIGIPLRETRKVWEPFESNGRLGEVSPK